MPAKKQRSNSNGSRSVPPAKSNRTEQLIKGPTRAIVKAGDTALLYRGIGFPDEFITDLVYTKSVLTSSTASADFQQLQSSLFDPDPAVGGSQPTFFDQLAAVYARYQILSMRAEVEVVGATSATLPVSVAWAWTDESTTPSTVDQLSLYRYSGAKTVVNGGGPIRFTTSMDMGRLHGYSDVTQVNELQALVSASPADLAYFTVGTVPYDATTATVRFTRIRMVYRCRFFALLTPAAS